MMDRDAHIRELDRLVDMDKVAWEMKSASIPDGFVPPMHTMAWLMERTGLDREAVTVALLRLIHSGCVRYRTDAIGDYRWWFHPDMYYKIG
jgi:hypothetical protein